MRIQLNCDNVCLHIYIYMYVCVACVYVICILINYSNLIFAKHDMRINVRYKKQATNHSSALGIVPGQI